MFFISQQATIPTKKNDNKLNRNSFAITNLV